jgi:hypothetical protein
MELLYELLDWNCDLYMYGIELVLMYELNY